MEHQPTTTPNLPPRVLIFPLPVEGHVNPMLKLAELLALASVHVTFLNTDHVHRRLLRHAADVEGRFAAYPGFLFRTISDGLPEDHPRWGKKLGEMVCSMLERTKPTLKEMLLSGVLGSVTCIIGDGLFGSLTNDIGNELCIPIIHFRTFSACSFWVYFSIPHIIDARDLPIRGKDDMDRIITSVPGMESFLRCRDLPSFCQVSDITEPTPHLLARQTNLSCQSEALILNTFEDLEGPIVSHIRNHCPKVYTIGPLQAHLNVKLAMSNGPSSQSHNSLFEVDRNCMTWLDSKPLKSVIYVSFGSIVTVTRELLMEFWHGLVNSNKPFLWVIRPDMLEDGDGEIPQELSAATKERGYIVGWVPQEEVLAHQAVGGFLTHGGWNSTLESIVAGVPMICRPFLGDQQINSRYVSEVWKLGVEMKDVCDRNVVEKMVNDLMVERREEYERSTAEMARWAQKSVNECGSSYCNLEHLIEHIRLISASEHPVDSAKERLTNKSNGD